MLAPLTIDQDEVLALRRELKALSHDAASQTDSELASYLHIQRSVLAAVNAVVDAAKWKRENPVSIQDVAPFYRCPPGHTSPSSCLVCLEDMRGGVARDKQGRPIVVLIGLLFGTAREVQLQFAYAMQRAALYRQQPDGPLEICFVVEVSSREPGTWMNLNRSFRIPDAPIFSLFDFMRRYFPESQFSTVHFCGLPGFCVSTFKIVKPFVSEVMWNRLKLKSSFKHLKEDNVVDPSCLLPQWDKDGTFQFDIDTYVDWRAKEEGFSLLQICPRNQGRYYNARVELGRQLTTHDLLGTADHRDQIIKYGPAQKQGSGVGMFASNRWKSKFLVLSRGMLVYFGSSKISPSNAATRVIPIDASTHVCRSHDESKKAILRLESNGREYTFGFGSDAVAYEWMDVLLAECAAATQLAVSASPTSVKKIAGGRFSLEDSTNEHGVPVSLPMTVTVGV